MTAVTSISANTALNGTASIEARPHRKTNVQPRRSDSPYQGRTAQKDNPTQLIIKQAVDHLMQQIEAGKSETLTAYLTAMARFHNYSFGNILAIARQRPAATRVAGFRTWKEMGRFVKRGEKGIQILAPMVGYRRKRTEAEEESTADAKPQPVLIGFRVVHVWDISQTEGAELPKMEYGVSGEVGGLRDRLMNFLIEQNIALEFNENIAPALGVSYGGKIALLPGQSKPQEFVTLVHETAHELLHKAERRTLTTATVRETEAEAVAFVVGQAVGLEMGRSSSDYIQLYNGNSNLLAESLEFVQRTSGIILAALSDPEVAEMAPEQFAAAS
ncbi:MAG: DUF1738 domain-containing protein [Silvibacterium sp.]|nr:DUF1738 domain-containing protein [Silvibacterium sp.]